MDPKQYKKLTVFILVLGANSFAAKGQQSVSPPAPRGGAFGMVTAVNVWDSNKALANKKDSNHSFGDSLAMFSKEPLFLEKPDSQLPTGTVVLTGTLLNLPRMSLGTDITITDTKQNKFQFSAGAVVSVAPEQVDLSNGQVFANLGATSPTLCSALLCLKMEQGDAFVSADKGKIDLVILKGKGTYWHRKNEEQKIDILAGQFVSQQLSDASTQPRRALAIAAASILYMRARFLMDSEYAWEKNQSVVSQTLSEHHQDTSEQQSHASDVVVKAPVSAPSHRLSSSNAHPEARALASVEDPTTILNLPGDAPGTVPTMTEEESSKKAAERKTMNLRLMAHISGLSYEDMLVQEKKLEQEKQQKGLDQKSKNIQMALRREQELKRNVRSLDQGQRRPASDSAEHLHPNAKESKKWFDPNTGYNDPFEELKAQDRDQGTINGPHRP